jgi:hypothetical protein
MLGEIRCLHVFTNKLERFFLRVGMTENKTEGNPGIGSYLANETGFVLMLSVASYIFAYVSQREYLKAFGIDEAFVTVGLEDVVRSGVWLLGFLVVIAWLLQMPFKLVSKLLSTIFCFYLSVSAFVVMTFSYNTKGVIWATVILGLIFVMFFCFESFQAARFLWKGGSWSEYLQRQIDIEKQVLDVKIEQKLIDVIGGNTWKLVIFLLFVPYGFGLIIGDREAKNKSEFLQFSDAEESYIIVHEASGIFVAVGYEDRGAEPAVLNSHVKVLLSEGLSEISLENRKFNRDGLLFFLNLQSYRPSRSGIGMTSRRYSSPTSSRQNYGWSKPIKVKLRQHAQNGKG